MLLIKRSTYSLLLPIGKPVVIFHVYTLPPDGVLPQPQVWQINMNQSINQSLKATILIVSSDYSRSVMQA